MEPFLQVLLAHLVHLVVEETGARKEEEKPGWHQGQVVLWKSELEIRKRKPMMWWLKPGCPVQQQVTEMPESTALILRRVAGQNTDAGVL